MHRFLFALTALVLPVVALAQPIVSSEEIPAGQTADVELRRIAYKSGDLVVNGYLAMPKKGTKLPCVILNRGGNAKFSVWTDEVAARALGKFASWGYIAVASQYRGADGAPGHDEWGGADVDDVLNLIPVLESLPRADATRIGMAGWSRGGMMAYIALTRTDRIAAAVINSGVADLNLSDRPEMERVWSVAIPEWEKNGAEELAKRSAVRWADKLNKTTPILLLHGTADWRAPVKTNAINMAARLYDAKHPFRMVLFEGAQHGLREHYDEADRITHDWLDRYVRDRKPWPSLEPHGD